MHPRVKQIGLILVSLVLFGATLGWLVSRPSSFAPPPIPNPNGYDDFVQAGQLLPQPPADWPDADLETLRILVAAQAEAVALAREGLTQECRVPLAYTMDDSANFLPGLSASKSLLMALCTEFRLARAEGRHRDAARACLDAFALGSEATRGGLLIHAMVRTGTDAVACQQLRGIQPALGVDEAKEAAVVLGTILAKRESLAALLERETVWAKEVGTVRGRIAEVIAARSLQPNKAALQRASQRALQVEQQTLRLLIDLASQAYELERGEPPGSIDALTPQYLKAIPIDPVTGDPLRL
jgi:hypothetical protein